MSVQRHSDVAQTFKSAVSRAFKPAAAVSLTALGPLLDALPTWKSAIQQTWKSNAARNWNLVWRVSCSELLARWKRRELSSPSPRPSPQGRGRCQARRSHSVRARRLVARPAWLPLPWGEGRGEGELGRRTDAAAQNVFGTRETEPQFLAALDKNVRAPERCELRTSRVPRFGN